MKSLPDDINQRSVKEAWEKFIYKEETVRKIIAALAQKISIYIGQKTIFYVISNAAIHPLGFAGDFAQFSLEILGYDEEAKLAGIVGNFAGGVISGMSAGGPLGAVAGGATGLAIWGFGEYGVETNYLVGVKNAIDLLESGFEKLT